MTTEMRRLIEFRKAMRDLREAVVGDDVLLEFIDQILKKDEQIAANSK